MSRRQDWVMVERMRRGVDPSTDSLLALWGRAMRIGQAVELGYPRSSAGFGSGRSLHSWEDLEDGVEGSMAQAADAIIDGMGELKRPIWAIYLGCRFGFGEDGFEERFSESVEKFERLAIGRGLL